MKFKKSMFGFIDMLKFKGSVKRRTKMMQQAPATPIPTTYRVNETAKALHPEAVGVVLTSIVTLSHDTKEFNFANATGTRLPHFKAGQYVALRAEIGGNIVSRAYTIASSPRDAKENRIALAVKNCGYFSSYLFETAKVGDLFLLSDPTGDFYYDCNRDKKNIVGIAGGSGITPFHAMAKAICEGQEDCNLTIVYGARKEADLLYKEDLDRMAGERIKVVYVLSEEKDERYESGFITGELLQKYCDVKNASFFLCGPNAMYSFVTKELTALGVERKNVRREVNAASDLKLDAPKSYQLKVRIRNDVQTIPAHENETLLVAMERAGIAAPNKCRGGVCGFCHSKLVSGECEIPKDNDGRRAADLKFGYIHPCCTYPKSDMEIDVPFDASKLHFERTQEAVESKKKLKVANEVSKFAHKMAGQYSNRAYTKDFLLEFYFTDVKETYQMDITNDGCRLIEGTESAYTTRIETPYVLWKAVSEGKISATDALYDHKYRVLGDFSVMYNLEKMFTVERPVKSEVDKRKNPFLLWFLLPYIVMWCTLPFGNFVGGIATACAIAAGLVIQWFYKSTVYEGISHICALAVVVLTILNVNNAILVPIPYLVYGIIWMTTVFLRIPLTGHYMYGKFGGKAALNNKLYLRTNRITTIVWAAYYLVAGVVSCFAPMFGLGSLWGLVANLPVALVGVFTVVFVKKYVPAYGRRDIQS